MISPNKRSANRTNAKRSTGPRTAKGKEVASRNSLKHGLARSVIDFEPHSAEIKQLATTILESFNGQGDLELAARIAEAQIDLQRVRQARHAVLKRALSSPSLADRSGFNPNTKSDEDPSHEWPNGKSRPGVISEEHAHQMADRGSLFEAEHVTALSKDLLALDRYERRAFSRRKFAIRDFQLSLLA